MNILHNGKYFTRKNKRNQFELLAIVKISKQNANISQNMIDV